MQHVLPGTFLTPPNDLAWVKGASDKPKKAPFFALAFEGKRPRGPYYLCPHVATIIPTSGRLCRKFEC